jgi:hypothetical protein
MTTYSISLNSQKDILVDVTHDAVALAHILGLPVDETALQEVQGQAIKLWKNVVTNMPEVLQCSGGGTCGWK